MEVSQHAKYFCEFCGKVCLIFISLYLKLSLLFCILVLFTVLREEEGNRHLELQGLRQSQSWWGLHSQVSDQSRDPRYLKLIKTGFLKFDFFF